MHQALLDGRREAGRASAHAGARLLAAIFGAAPSQDHLEVRPLPVGQIPGELRFPPLRQFQRRGFEQTIPLRLDGKADVYFGVCTRRRRGGKALDVGVAACLWADLDLGLPDPWPATIPTPSALVETSPGNTRLTGCSRNRHQIWVQSRRWSDASRPACTGTGRPPTEAESCAFQDSPTSSTPSGPWPV